VLGLSYPLEVLAGGGLITSSFCNILCMYFLVFTDCLQCSCAGCVVSFLVRLCSVTNAFVMVFDLSISLLSKHLSVQSSAHSSYNPTCTTQAIDTDQIK
jgi:hypothetical protein